MTDTPDLPIESDMEGETKEEKTNRLNFFSDAVRAGLHASAMDIFEQMEATGVPDVPACLLAGGCQFLAEIYEGMATKTNADKAKFKEHLITSVGLYYDVYCQMSVKDALAAAQRGEEPNPNETVQ